jgi:hypothetical protein
MNAATNTGSNLPANPANLVLIVTTSARTTEHCHNSEHPRHYTIESIHERADAVTPLLKKILDYSPPGHAEFED